VPCHKGAGAEARWISGGGFPGLKAGASTVVLLRSTSGAAFAGEVCGYFLRWSGTSETSWPDRKAQGLKPVGLLGGGFPGLKAGASTVVLLRSTSGAVFAGEVCGEFSSVETHD
jgi:hypothetical protein